MGFQVGDRATNSENRVCFNTTVLQYLILVRVNYTKGAPDTASMKTIRSEYLKHFR